MDAIQQNKTFHVNVSAVDSLEHSMKNKKLRKEIGRYERTEEGNVSNPRIPLLTMANIPKSLPKA